jgi:TonB family protein
VLEELNMKTFLLAVFCSVLSACGTSTQISGNTETTKATTSIDEVGVSKPTPYPKLRSAMPQMPCQKPTWPKEAIRRGITGTVTMKFLIDADGRVLEKEIVESSGHKLLDSAALDATARCKLIVAPTNGKLEKEWVMNQYVWTLD